METKSLSIPKISCGHCVKAIQRELEAVKGVKRVDGDPALKAITVTWESPASLQQIKAVLKDMDYPAVD